MLLDRRVAIVTGASRGIGASIAQRFAGEGARVAVVARSEPQFPGTIEETVAEIEKAGGISIPIEADLRRLEDCERAVAVVEESLGTVDILVNNAAVTVYQAFDAFPVKYFDLMFDVQVRAPFVLAQRVLPGMKERGEGWILNITSSWSEHPTPPYPDWTTKEGTIVYGMCKIALNRFTTGLAAETHALGIRVNALGPSGRVVTPGSNHFGFGSDDRYPLERPGAIVDAALAFCGGAGRDFTGRVVSSHEILDELAAHDPDRTGWE